MAKMRKTGARDIKERSRFYREVYTTTTYIFGPERGSMRQI